jgi:hypothetical protein
MQEKGEKGTIQELYQLYWSLDIIRTVKWQGYDGQCIYKEWVIVKHPEASHIFRLEGRTVRRPKLWWMDSVVDDPRKLGIQKWWMVMVERQLCERVIQVA